MNTIIACCNTPIQLDQTQCDEKCALEKNKQT